MISFGFVILIVAVTRWIAMLLARYEKIRVHRNMNRLHLAGGCWQGAEGIKLTRLEVPEFVDPRTKVLMLCAWDLDGEVLQSVKWFRNEQPFFEYRMDHARYIAHPVDGIFGQRCDCHATQCTVELTVYPRLEQATYACEVSGEGPRFRVTNGNRSVAVRALPSSGPRITGLPAKVLPDTDVQLNCSTQKSLPAAQLTWFINDQPTDSELHTRREPDGLYTSWSTLTLRISRDEAKQVECHSEHFAYNRQLSLVKASVLVAERPALASQLHDKSSGFISSARGAVIFTAVFYILTR